MTLRSVATDTLAVLKAGGYSAPSGAWAALAAEQAAAVAGTRVWTEAELAVLSPPAPAKHLEVRVEDATTQVAALTASGDARVGLLNFASARNPGGGFRNGARAQEEDLARCSGLYPCLAGSSARPYYTLNRSRSSHLYSHTLIFSPGVPFFRTRSKRSSEGWLLERPFVADVITAPAPNAGAARRATRTGPALTQALRERARYVLALAAHAGVETLILGAWGCGVFRNDPQLVADAFFDPLEAEGSSVRTIVFAVPASHPRNHAAFQGRLASSPWSS